MTSVSDPNTGIFIFRRDLRIFDNIGLHEMTKICKRIIPIFIFTPEQVTEKNKFRSKNAIQFMIESLDDLAGNLSIHKSGLYCFMGENVDVIQSVLKHVGARHIGFNRDYTPYAFKRDREIADLCAKLDVQCHQFDDYYLFPPGTLTKDGFQEIETFAKGERGAEGTQTQGNEGVHFDDYYRKFTPFYEKAKKEFRHMRKSVVLNPKSLSKMDAVKGLTTVHLTDMYIRHASMNPNVSCRGGRRYALDALADARQSQRRYSETRDRLIVPTSRMSAYIKFGCVSIGEVFESFKNISELVRQLIWREFYAHTLFVFPEVLTQYSWRENQGNATKTDALFKAWKDGETGVPIVDACMRELNKTGYMHNRGRLIVASYLAKTLGVDWRMGERYFAQQLVDYDVASNNGNWRWIASAAELKVQDGSREVTVHLDTQPPFRTFSPWLQAKKCDPDAEYIKKWVPELRTVEPKEILRWKDVSDKYPLIKYPKAN
jgi:deoxyribodipyrimidine photo-lyase